MLPRRILLSVLTLFLLCSMLSASQLGVGIILGSPTGLSMKLWRSRKVAFDLALAWDFGNDYFHIHGDYLYHFPLSMEGISQRSLYSYLGIGARMKFRNNRNGEDNSILGLRGVGGLEFIPHSVPLDMFIEIAPVMSFIPKTDFDLEGGVGIRYSFNL